MDASELKRVKELGEEMSRLKHMYSDLALENDAMRKLIEKKVLTTSERKESVEHLCCKGLSSRKACNVMLISRTAVSRPTRDSASYNTLVVEALNEAVQRNQRCGFRKCYHWMCNRGNPWNPKGVHRVYCKVRLNLPHRTKRHVPIRPKVPLEALQKANEMWSMDFIHDRLYSGKAFWTLNIIDKGVREVLVIEVGKSFPAERVATKRGSLQVFPAERVHYVERLS